MSKFFSAERTIVLARGDYFLLNVAVRLCADQNLARQNLARMASATSSGLRSIRASPQMRSK
jgi:hypothetical protein